MVLYSCHLAFYCPAPHLWNFLGCSTCHHRFPYGFPPLLQSKSLDCDLFHAKLDPGRYQKYSTPQRVYKIPWMVCRFGLWIDRSPRIHIAFFSDPGLDVVSFVKSKPDLLHCLLRHFPVQRSLQAPEPSLDVVHTDNEARKGIIEVVNSTWNNGIAVGMESLPSVIAVCSTSIVPSLGLNLSIA